MDAVNPWLDPSEVRHLADQLLRPVAPARLAAADPGFDQTFVGYTSPSHQPTPSPEPHPSHFTPSPELPIGDHFPENPPPTADLPPPPEPPPVAVPTTLVKPPSTTRFLERIEIFRSWLSRNFQARDTFILDREGKVIFDESGHGRLHFMARNLALASRNSDSQSSNIHVKIGPSAVLEVIPCDTPYGRIVLGTLVPESLPIEHIRTIAEVLAQTATPG